MQESNREKKNLLNSIQLKAAVIRSIREFFWNRDFLDVIAPPIVESAGVDCHIHPMIVTTSYPTKKRIGQLHNSPELYLKKIISCGVNRNFSIGHCFRNEQGHSPIHGKQFLMLEWYRGHSNYREILSDCMQLIRTVHQKLEELGYPLLHPQHEIVTTETTMSELFYEHLKITLDHHLSITKIKSLIQTQFPEISLPQNPETPWEDYFYLIFLNKIWPIIKEIPFLVIFDFPAHLRSLSKISSTNPRYCERFELYYKGMELANCYNEVNDLKTTAKIIRRENAKRHRLYGDQRPFPATVLQNFQLPQDCAGMALGIERLIMALTPAHGQLFETDHETTDSPLSKGQF